MKRQAGRPNKENLVPVGLNFSREVLANQTGESQSQIQRYIRLTHLIPELLELVDDDKIKLRPAVELSYIDEKSQRNIADEIEAIDSTPSHAQAIKMRKFFEDGKLTAEVISSIMSELKPNQKEKFVIDREKVQKLIPENIPLSQTEEYVLKALSFYKKYLRSKSERESR